MMSEDHILNTPFVEKVSMPTYNAHSVIITWADHSTISTQKEYTGVSKYAANYNEVVEVGA